MAAAEEERYQPQHEEDSEENLCNPDGRTCESGEAENACNEGDDKKYEGPVEHGSRWFMVGPHGLSVKSDRRAFAGKSQERCQGRGSLISKD